MQEVYRCLLEKSYGNHQVSTKAGYQLVLIHTKTTLVHRDISLNNFFIFPNDTTKIFLNDWGCAVNRDVETTFSGCLVNAPDEVLEIMAKNNSLTALYKPKQYHDLEMVIKCLYGRFDPLYFSIASETDFNKILNFWKSVTATFWRTLFKNAKDCAYDKLISNIPKLFT